MIAYAWQSPTQGNQSDPNFLIKYPANAKQIPAIWNLLLGVFLPALPPEFSIAIPYISGRGINQGTFIPMGGNQGSRRAFCQPARASYLRQTKLTTIGSKMEQMLVLHTYMPSFFCSQSVFAKSDRQADSRRSRMLRVYYTHQVYFRINFANSIPR